MLIEPFGLKQLSNASFLILYSLCILLKRTKLLIDVMLSQIINNHLSNLQQISIFL